MNNKFKAFSLVEVLISVFLVSVGLLTALSLLTKGLSETMDSRNQVIAGLLAQEGVELVRSIRDANWANDVPLAFQGIDDGKKQMDYNDTSVSNGTTYRLQLDNSGFYNHGSGANTNFFRMIEITSDNPTYGPKTILSMVTWNDNGFIGAFDKSNCNTANKCAYQEDELTRWGEE